MAAVIGPGDRFFVGKEFSSFTELEESVNSYCSEKLISIYIRTSRSIDAAVRSHRIRQPTVETSALLKYYEIEYACIHGGKNYTSRGKGKRSCR